MKEDEGNKDDTPESNLPDQTKIYEAISHILELAIYFAKMDEDEEVPDCKDGDLRDWPQMNDIDYTDEFKEEFE